MLKFLLFNLTLLRTVMFVRNMGIPIQTTIIVKSSHISKKWEQTNQKEYLIARKPLNFCSRSFPRKWRWVRISCFLLKKIISLKYHRISSFGVIVSSIRENVYFLFAKVGYTLKSNGLNMICNNNPLSCIPYENEIQIVKHYKNMIFRVHQSTSKNVSLSCNQTFLSPKILWSSRKRSWESTPLPLLPNKDSVNL